MSYTLGIDVGTTFTAAAVWRDGVASVVPLGRRSDSVQTLLYRRGDEWVMGDTAERHSIVDSQHIARAFKRRMGDDVPVRIGAQSFSAVELTAQVIGWVLGVCKSRFGESPAHVALTYPAGWGAYRADRVREAGLAAGVGARDLSLITEPIASVSYYALQTKVATGSTVAVYDLGGGTFDATLARKIAGGFELVGDPTGIEVGGVDVDERILRFVIDSIGQNWQTLDLADPDTLTALAALRDQIVLAKEALSDDVETTVPVVLPGMVERIRLTRTELNSLAHELISATVAGFQTLLERNHLTAADLSATLLVGGGSRMPMVAERLSSELNVRVAVDAHPKYAVCLGAATLAAVDQPAVRADDRLPQQRRSSSAPRVSPRGTMVPAPATVAGPGDLAGRPVPFSAMGLSEIRTQSGAAGSAKASVSMIADLVSSGLVDSRRGGALPGDVSAFVAAAGSTPHGALVVRTREAGPASRRGVLMVVVVVVVTALLVVTGLLLWLV